MSQHREGSTQLAVSCFTHLNQLQDVAAVQLQAVGLQTQEAHASSSQWHRLRTPLPCSPECKGRKDRPHVDLWN